MAENIIDDISISRQHIIPLRIALITTAESPSIIFGFFLLKKSLKLLVTFFFLLLLFGVQKGLKQYQQPLDLFRALTSGNLNIFHYFGRNYSLSHFRIGP